jgi:hypothetical protein
MRSLPGTYSITEPLLVVILGAEFAIPTKVKSDLGEAIFCIRMFSFYV